MTVFWAARPFTTTSAVAVSDSPEGLVRDVVIRTACTAALFAKAASEDREPEPASYTDGTDYTGVVEVPDACSDQRRQRIALLVANFSLATVIVLAALRIASDS